jgi:hypothetical protein
MAATTDVVRLFVWMESTTRLAIFSAETGSITRPGNFLGVTGDITQPDRSWAKTGSTTLRARF